MGIEGMVVETKNPQNFADGWGGWGGFGAYRTQEFFNESIGALSFPWAIFTCKFKDIFF